MWGRGFCLLGLVLVSGFLGYLIGANYGQPEGGTELHPATSGFIVSDLSIEPAEVQPKEAVTITVSVANTHHTWGLYNLVLEIDDVKETEGKAMVAAGSTENVTFCVAREEPGTYSVFVNGLSGSFTVVAPEEEVKAEVIREVITVEVPVELRYFESVQELKDWLQQVPMRVHLVANSDGIIQLQGVCDDVAIDLQDRAIEDGYKMSIEMLGRDEYQKWYGEWLDEGRLHAVNSAIIGNEVWLIDFLADKVWLGAYLDDPK